MKNAKEAIALRAELCKDKIDSSPLRKNLNGFTNTRLNRDRKKHYEDNNTTFSVKNRKI